MVKKLSVVIIFSPKAALKMCRRQRKFLVGAPQAKKIFNLISKNISLDHEIRQPADNDK